MPTYKSKFADPSSSIPPPFTGSHFGEAAPKPAGGAGYSPLDWSDFFDTREMIAEVYSFPNRF